MNMMSLIDSMPKPKPPTDDQTSTSEKIVKSVQEEGRSAQEEGFKIDNGLNAQDAGDDSPLQGFVNKVKLKRKGGLEKILRDSGDDTCVAPPSTLDDINKSNRGSLKLVTSFVLVLVTDLRKLVSTRDSSGNWLVLRQLKKNSDSGQVCCLLIFRTVHSSGYCSGNWLVLMFAGNWLVLRFCVISVNWLLRQLKKKSDSGQVCCLLIFRIVHSSGYWLSTGNWFRLTTGTYYPSTLGSGPLAGTQGSTTQDPHIAASDSSFDFDVMEVYPMQQHPENSSQDMNALGQQPGASMFSCLKETLSRATRFEHATNEINKGGGEVDSPFTSQIDSVLPESAHVSTPATTPIGPLKPTLFETLLPDGRSFAEVQEVERYILAAREKKIESLHKAEQRRAILAHSY
ncbi:hypothetical protein L7F22_045289 [Adiantum nelumboides]|nr:hypothetical protein [Adiantum nelumboides]